MASILFQGFLFLPKEELGEGMPQGLVLLEELVDGLEFYVDSRILPLER